MLDGATTDDLGSFQYSTNGGASWADVARNMGQIVALAGCDLLTIAPDLLAALQASHEPLPGALDAEAARRLDQRDHADLHQFLDIQCSRNPAMRVPGDLAHQPKVGANQLLRVRLC